MRYWVVLVVAFASCKRDRPHKPEPAPAVHIRRLSPVIGERFTFRVQDSLKLVLTDGTQTASAIEETDTEAEEVVTAVRSDMATERTIRFITFHHRPLGGEPLDAKAVVGKTYRWTGQTPADITDAERAALKSYVRRDTGEPDLATHLLTDRDFQRGVAWTIPADQPAPFARGMHAGASITLSEIDQTLAIFDITQIMVLEPRGERVPLTLKGRVVMDIATARIQSIDVDGHITERTGPLAEAHMTSHQTFMYPR